MSEVRSRPVFNAPAVTLGVYQKPYKLAMRVFELNRDFLLEEKFALTSQIRRSSRSVCLNLRGRNVATKRTS